MFAPPLFRQVSLPPDVAGQLYLHSLPGRYEPFAHCRAALDRHGITRIVSLLALDEIAQRSPEYAEAITAATLPCAWEAFPIPDFGVPSDMGQFAALVGRLAEGVQAGERVLIHCGAGIGRTGTVALCHLLALGIPMAEAERAVRAAGAGPETAGQRRWVEGFADAERTD